MKLQCKKCKRKFKVLTENGTELFMFDNLLAVGKNESAIPSPFKSPLNLSDGIDSSGFPS